MKSRNLLGLCSLLALFSACGNGAPKYDATGTFETTEVLVSAEASGRLLYFDIEEGMLLKAGEEVGVVDTVQLYLKKLQLEASLKSVEEQRPDILKQVAATKEQISAAQRERNRVANLLKVGAANQKQLDDAEDQLEVLRKQLVAQNSTLSNSHQSLTWQSSTVTRNWMLSLPVVRNMYGPLQGLAALTSGRNSTRVSVGDLPIIFCMAVIRKSSLSIHRNLWEKKWAR